MLIARQVETVTLAMPYLPIAKRREHDARASSVGIKKTNCINGRPTCFRR